MGKIILISCDKGGATKSTTAAALASAMVSEGKKVLLVDLDSHCSLTETFLNAGTFQEESTVYHALVNNAPFSPVRIRSGLHILPATVRVGKLNDFLREQMNIDFVLKTFLAPLKRKYDFIILDSAGHFDFLTRNALTAADYVLIPFVGDEYSVIGVEHMLDYVKIAQAKTNRTLRVAGLIQTRYAGRIADKSTRNVIEDLAGNNGVTLFRTVIAESTYVSQAPARKTDIISYKPSCKAAVNYMDLYAELKEKLK